MKIFILEDSIERIKRFKARFFKADLFIAESVNEAVKLFKENYPFDVIFLDHDLGGEEMVESVNENTGYQFSKFISGYDLKGVDIIVHSLNPQGADNIIQLLKGNDIRSRRVPFTALFS